MNRLSAEVAHLHSQLEKGEVVKLNLEYELVKVNKELAAECRLRLEHEATSAETLQTLQRTLVSLLHVITRTQLVLRWPTGT